MRHKCKRPKRLLASMGVARIFSGGGDTFRKFSKKFRKKIEKNALFLHMKFREKFLKFLKNFLRKLRKCIILAYFTKKT